jgi:hypothetical protein
MACAADRDRPDRLDRPDLDRLVDCPTALPPEAATDPTEDDPTEDDSADDVSPACSSFCRSVASISCETDSSGASSTGKRLAAECFAGA